MGFRDEELPFPEPHPFVKASGLRRAYVQEAVDTRGLTLGIRAAEMARVARRAVEFFDNSFHNVEWHTIEFRVVNHGMEAPDTELWRWEVWVK
jgi:hypothetical protein